MRSYITRRALALIGFGVAAGAASCDYVFALGTKGDEMDPHACYLLEQSRLAVEILTGKPTHWYKWEISKDRESVRGSLQTGGMPWPVGEQGVLSFRGNLPWAGKLHFWLDGQEYRTANTADAAVWVSRVGPDDKDGHPADGVWVGGLNFAQRYTGPVKDYKLYSLQG